MPQHARLSDFVKSSPRRFQDALELMEQPTASGTRSDAATRHLRGAMYLAGYAVELLLKAYLIEQERSQSIQEAQGKINKRRSDHSEPPIKNIATTAAGHSIEYLIRLTDLPERTGYDPELWGRVAVWSSGWRYDPDPPGRVAAQEFVEDVQAALNWLTPKIMRAPTKKKGG